MSVVRLSEEVMCYPLYHNAGNSHTRENLIYYIISQTQIFMAYCELIVTWGGGVNQITAQCPIEPKPLNSVWHSRTVNSFGCVPRVQNWPIVIIQFCVRLIQKLTVRAQWLPSVPPAVTFKGLHILLIRCIRVSNLVLLYKQRLCPSTAFTDWAS
jgi:hypothetical protein